MPVANGKLVKKVEKVKGNKSFNGQGVSLLRPRISALDPTFSRDPSGSIKESMLTKEI
jgi:hypothetical protein